MSACRMGVGQLAVFIRLSRRVSISYNRYIHSLTLVNVTDRYLFLQLVLQ